MNKLFFLFVTFLFLNAPAPKQANKSKAAVFKHYISTLNQIPLPLSSWAMDLKFGQVSPNYDKNGFEKFQYQGAARPLGILFRDSKHIVLVDLSMGDEGPVPFLTCYDLDGNKTDLLGPFEISGGDEDFEGVERVIITKNRQITVFDTTRTWELDKKGNRVSHSTTEVTGVTHYYLTPEGKFTSKHVNTGTRINL